MRSTDSFPDLSPLLNPASIAIVGASERSGSPGRLVLENLRQLEYAGKVYAIHPKYDQVLGYPCYPDLGALSEPVDLVAVLLSAEKVLTTLESAANAGARAAWVLASGFAEAGPDGKARQDQISELATSAGLLVCGPNCIGVANIVDRVAAWSVALSCAVKPGVVSAVIQSGAVALGLVNIARLGLRYIVSSGNEALLDSADYINYFVKDPETKVIAAFLEGIRSPERFVAAAQAAITAGKPILLIKVGRSELARRAIQAHTGNLVGSSEVFDAVCRRLGIVQLETLDELIETAELFSTSPLPDGKGIGLLSLSGGQIGLAADTAQDLGLQFPPISARARAALETILPPFSSIANPLDAWGSGDLKRSYPKCVEIVAGESEMHLLAISRDTPPDSPPQELEQSIAVVRAAMTAQKHTGKPVVLFSNYSAGVHPNVKRQLGTSRVPYLQGTSETLCAVKALIEYAQFRRLDRKARVSLECGLSQEKVTTWRERLREQRVLTEIQSRELLATYKIQGPKERMVSTIEQAVECAEEIGYPVAVKISSPDIQHKTDVGGVRLGLVDAEGVRLACRELTQSVQMHQPEARLEGLLVQEMIRGHSVEVILGIVCDPDFGPTLVFGSGGVLTELLKDVSVRIPPLDRSEALEMIEETKVGRLLQGYRGRPDGDIDAVVDTLVRLSDLAIDLGDQITALDINPLLVMEQGQGVRAVDVLVVSR